MLLASADGDAITPVAWKSDGTAPPAAGAVEPIGGDTAAARAVLSGATLVFGPGGHSCDELPEWARRYGAASAIVLPIFRGPWLLGAAYALRKDAHTATPDEIHQAELAVSVGARMLASVAPSVEPGQPADVVSFLDPSMGGAVRDLAPLSFPGVCLDPVREQVQIEDVSVSLSRTEFIMLYTLAQQPGSIVPHHALLEACWQDDVPSLGAVDATVYRLRKKLSHAPGGRNLVRTVRGEGYALRLPRGTVTVD